MSISTLTYNDFNILDEEIVETKQQDLNDQLSRPSSTVTKEEQDKIVAIVNKIKGPVKKTLEEYGCFFIENETLTTIIDYLVLMPFIPFSLITKIGLMTLAGINKYNNLFSTHKWQLIGICGIERTKMNAIIQKLNEVYRNELGEYKILPYRSTSSIINYVRYALKKKSFNTAYGTFILAVGKSADVELQKHIEDADKNANDKEQAKQDAQKKQPTKTDQIKQEYTLQLSNRLDEIFNESFQLIDQLYKK